ncbi:MULTISPECIES: ATP-dependent helicase [Clostridium]|uniref:ATP-dependent helicase n=1 Tax=Clostridium TaxID=1485 RepID=UPI00082555A1|nr:MULTISPECIES: ATP-dependent helicase [Clostridium]PJI10235.1 ATP-dependent helicase [Clostridium sp. CT7]
MKVLNHLNDNQLRAVTSDSKTILCLAGAGSGKTTVLTNRISYLNETQRVGGSSILCVTFTRNAAKEMKDRIKLLMGEEEGGKVFCNTFHAFCISILKEWGFKTGYNKEFSIYDQDDKEDIIKNILVDLCICHSKEAISTRDILNSLECIEHQEYRAEKYPALKNYILAAGEYRHRLKKNSAVDLDMLLNDAVKLLEKCSEVKEYYHKKYEYIFCDEFQDCDDIQVKLLKIINPRNLFVVGDPDQCIYEWRKAKPKYIVNFESYFSNCDVIKLEDNYRSTKEIINAANKLIFNNDDRVDKKLIAHKEGENIEVLTLKNTGEEAEFIAHTIGNYNRNSKDFAVLSRTNKQLNIIAQKLREGGISYQIINNSQDIFKKHDIRKIFNFITAAVNTKDDRAVKRAVNFPKSILNAAQISKVELRCSEMELSFFEGLQKLKFKAQDKIDLFLDRVSKLEEFIIKENSNAYDVFKYVVELLDIQELYRTENRDSKSDDIYAALEKISHWTDIQEEINQSVSISTFLKWLKTKDIQERLLEQKDAVRIMTVHAAKGLEFPIVFVVGMNEGTFPNKRSDIEEERRLFYVAITRAKEKLYITRPSKIVYRSGLEVDTEESRFIEEMNA